MSEEVNICPTLSGHGVLSEEEVLVANGIRICIYCQKELKSEAQENRESIERAYELMGL